MTVFGSPKEVTEGSKIYLKDYEGKWIRTVHVTRQRYTTLDEAEIHWHFFTSEFKWVWTDRRFWGMARERTSQPLGWRFSIWTPTPVHLVTRVASAHCVPSLALNHSSVLPQKSFWLSDMLCRRDSCYRSVQVIKRAKGNLHLWKAEVTHNNITLLLFPRVSWSHVGVLFRQSDAWKKPSTCKVGTGFSKKCPCAYTRCVCVSFKDTQPCILSWLHSFNHCIPVFVEDVLVNNEGTCFWASRLQNWADFILFESFSIAFLWSRNTFINWTCDAFSLKKLKNIFKNIFSQS